MDVAQALGIGGLQAPKEPIILKAGTVVKVGGFPFKLRQDTPVEGWAGNLNLIGPAVAKGGGSGG